MDGPALRETVLEKAVRVLESRVAREATARTTGGVTVTVNLRDGVPTAVSTRVEEANAK